MNFMGKPVTDWMNVQIMPTKRTRVFYVGIGEDNDPMSARSRKIIEEFKRHTNPSEDGYENIFIGQATNHTHVHIF